MDENIENPNSENGMDAPESEETLELELQEEQDVEVLKEKNRKLFARAKKAETENKKLKEPKPEKEEKKEEKPIVNEDILFKRIDERFEKRELDSLKLSDEIEKEVSNYAKLNNVSINAAASSEYIQFKIEKEKKKAEIEEASLGKNNKKAIIKNYEEAKLSDFDLKTPEGREEFKKYEEYLRKKLG